MEQGLQIFNHPQFGEIRAVVIEGVPWFSGKDVASALGYKDTKSALQDHVDEEDKRILKRGDLPPLENHIPKDVFPVDFVDGRIPNRGMTFVNESGIYSLVLSSKLPGAKEFKRWVTSEILPSIHKHGAYMTPEVKNQILNNPDFLISLANKIKEEQARNLVLREQNESLRAENDSMRPKALFADAVAASDTDILIGDLAKLLRQNGVNVGQNRLFRILRERDFLCGRRGDMWNMPTQKALDLGLFRVSESTVSKADGSIFVTRTTKVTGKGQTYFVDRFLSGKIPV